MISLYAISHYLYYNLKQKIHTKIKYCIIKYNNNKSYGTAYPKIGRECTEL